jgi:hypothetical protein
MNPISLDLHDELLRKRLMDNLDACGNDPRCLKDAAKMLAESYIQSRVAAKWLGREMGQQLPPGSLDGPDTPNRGPALD